MAPIHSGVLQAARDISRPILDKENCIDTLEQLQNQLLKSSDPFIRPEDHAKLRIDVRYALPDERRDSNDPTPLGPFFEPWPIGDFEQVSAKALDNRESLKYLRKYQPGIDEGIRGSRKPGRMPVAPRNWYPGDLIIRGMYPYLRKEVGEVDNALNDLQEWGIRHQICRDSMGVDAWSVRSGGTSPHIKVLMHGDAGAEEGLLCCDEILAILWAMLKRLRDDRFRKHLIAPVMLLSVLGECQGRILMAHFDGSRLVIYMSKLYRLFTTDKASYILFLRYLASREGRGDTESLPSTRV